MATLKTTSAVTPLRQKMGRKSSLLPTGIHALHLATALRRTESSEIELTFLTYDAELARAARTMNFKVEGA